MKKNQEEEVTERVVRTGCAYLDNDGKVRFSNRLVRVKEGHAIRPEPIIEFLRREAKRGP